MEPSSWTRILGCAALAASLTACAGVAPPTQRPPAELATPVAPGAETFVARWPVLEGFALDPVRDRALKTKLRLNVGKDLRARCALPEPRFDVDSSSVAADDEAAIARLARCFTHGPLRDRAVGLIGRADRTGDPIYNLGLGQRRADEVKKLFVQNGVASYRIVATTRGATAARGQFAGYTDDDDRRVDIVLRD